MHPGEAPTHGRIRRDPGFTLIEVLVVVAIIALLAGLALSLPYGDQRHAAVKSAAEELAATLRTARSLAVDQRIVCAVSFNIANGAGTSGRILNNHDGGHWYRTVGAVVNVDSETSLATYPRPNFVPWQSSNVGVFLKNVRGGWLGEKHVLAPKKVRFLALGDQDNGSGGWIGGNRFPVTYPRPWFGWFDQASRRLYPWGGYDTAIKDPAGRSCSGFYYEGQDGPISGSVNPADRSTTNTQNSPPVGFFTAGEVRPLVNAEWMDVVIEFYPDGTASCPGPMGNRRTSWWRRGGATDNNNGGGSGNGDFGDFTAFPGTTWNDSAPITSYLAHSGQWTVTLCPDMNQDNDVFASAEEALRSIWPMYRVAVTPLGEVKTILVSRAVPAGTVIDTTSITDWQNTSQIGNLYKNFIATSNSSGTLRGKPVTDFLTPDILVQRQWWMVYP